jgi:hypothetical protein
MFRIGYWTALSVGGLGAAYAIVLVIGMAMTGLSAPIIDPCLAVLEGLTFLSAPLLVLAMAALHRWAAVECRIYSLAALVFMALMAGTTMGVHFVELTVLRQTGMAGLAWPSIPYALELLAWDVFLGLSLLLAASVFTKKGLEASVRAGMIATGLLCIAGSAGPLLGNMQLQFLAVAGYAAGLPIVFLLLAALFRRQAVQSPIAPGF